MEGEVVQEVARPRRGWTYRMAALKLGMTEIEYRTKVEAGEKWCTLCQTWHPVAVFGRDRSRRDQLTHSCLTSIADSYRRKRGCPADLARGRRQAYRCSLCAESGHTKRRCPQYVRGAA
jgi:hypothetical protein